MKTLFDFMLDFASLAGKNPNFQNSKEFLELQDRMKNGISIDDYNESMAKLNKMQAEALSKLSQIQRQ